MPTTVELLAFRPSGHGATTDRTLGEWTQDQYLNVKDYGAVGNGVADDTDAIQACFNAAFGAYGSPNGITNAELNRPVYFPPGVYNVAPKITAKSITNVTDSGIAYGGGNLIRVTTATTSPSGYTMANGDMVYIRGVGGVTNANASYGVQNVTATTFDLRASTYNSSYTSGGTWCPPALRVNSVHGGLIFGAGRLSSQLVLIGNNCALISTNGFQYSNVRDMGFVAETGCISFDLGCDGNVATNLQSNGFTNCNFGGSGSTNCEYGIAVGMSQSMGSENTFLNCNIAGATIAGLAIWNYNALANTVIGGNNADCRYGILVNAGACPVITGVSFQNYTKTPHMDIRIDNGSQDGYAISGCRTESHNFLQTGPDLGYTITGCNQMGDTSGVFFSGSGHVVISGCCSLNGYVEGQAASVIINNSQFFRGSDYLTAGSNENYTYLEVKPQPILTQTGTTYTMFSINGGAKTVFTNSSPITVTIPKNSDGTNRLGTGSKYFVQQGGAGKVTFVGASGVTIRSRGSLLSLNGQYACGTLTCDGSDLWTLEGDIVA